ncbi:MAG: hypothetical protein HRT44_03770 [Bdellovibrionales bacterium]|nr:hypothetical protein [Bdellovibrionales bacterium]NQZ18362.1 hypothetical protein [Bdellovibrionales bacterium]
MFKSIYILASLLLINAQAWAQSEMCAQALQETRQCATMPAVSMTAVVVTSMLANRESLLDSLANNSQVLGMFVGACDQAMAQCSQACGTGEAEDTSARNQCFAYQAVVTLAKATLGQMQAQQQEIIAASGTQEVVGGGEPIEGGRNNELLVPPLEESEATAGLSDGTGVGVGGGLARGFRPEPSLPGAQKLEVKNKKAGTSQDNLPVATGNSLLQSSGVASLRRSQELPTLDKAAQSRLMNLRRISNGLSNNGAQSGSGKAYGKATRTDIYAAGSKKGTRTRRRLKKPSEILQAQMDKARTITSYNARGSFIFQTICQSYNRAEESMNISYGYVQCPKNP